MKITLYALFILCLLFACSAGKQKLYEQKMNELQLMMGDDKYNVLIDYFKDAEGRFPTLLNEVYLAYKQTYPEDIKQIGLRHFVDVLSKKKEWVGYFPIYSSDDATIISYVILSAGIDGKLDNATNLSNKLHLDDWKQKLNLYNPNEFDGLNIYSEEIENCRNYSRKGYTEYSTYNAIEEKSGNKDLLIYVHHLVICFDEKK